MKLPKYKQPQPPTIKLSQRSANILVELYYEMIHVYKSAGEIDFDQNDCELCVIGNGIRSGVLSIPKQKKQPHWSDTDFDRAVEAIKLPNETRISDGVTEDAVSNFLFGGEADITCLSDELCLLPGRPSRGLTESLDELDACVRIAGVLDRAGYIVSDLPNIPA